MSAKAGEAVASWNLAKEYGFTDVDGRRPDMGGYIEAQLDSRWGRLVAAVQKEFRSHGLDPGIVLEHERSRLRLRGRLETAGRGYARTYLVPELWMSSPRKLAADFHERYKKAIGEGRAPEASGGS